MTPRIPPEYKLTMPRWSHEDEELATFMRSELDLASWAIGAILGRNVYAVQQKLKQLGTHRPEGRKGAPFGRMGNYQRPPMVIRRLQA